MSYWDVMRENAKAFGDTASRKRRLEETVIDAARACARGPYGGTEARSNWEALATAIDNLDAGSEDA